MKYPLELQQQLLDVTFYFSSLTPALLKSIALTFQGWLVIIGLHICFAQTCGAESSVSTAVICYWLELLERRCAQQQAHIHVVDDDGRSMITEDNVPPQSHPYVSLSDYLSFLVTVAVCLCAPALAPADPTGKLLYFSLFAYALITFNSISA